MIGYFSEGLTVFYGLPHWPSHCQWIVPGTILD